MIALGLTGGMGMGKSTVAKMITEFGAPHWDFDAEVARGYGWCDVSELDPHQLATYCKTELVPTIWMLCGKAVVPHPRGDFMIVDRQILRDAVTADPNLLTAIENEVGPWLVRKAREFLQKCAMTGQPAAGVPVLFDAPLWFEPLGAARVSEHTGQVSNNLCNVITHRADKTYTAVVSCPAEIQRERCMARPGMTEEKFQLLLSRQLSDEERRDRADFIIDTTQPLETVRAQVERILLEIKLRSE